MTEQQELSEFIGKQVVVDTQSPYVFLGTLEACGAWFVTLRDVDVHDVSDSPSTKELYVMKARQHNIQPNRAVVKIRREAVVSISLLSDVLVYD